MNKSWKHKKIKVMTDEEAIGLFISCSVYTEKAKDKFEVARLEDRRVVWRKGGYGKRAYDSEMDILDDGRVYLWDCGKPKEINKSGKAD